MKKMVFIQHVPIENPGIILEWAVENDFETIGVMMYKNPKLPLPEEIDLLVVMGGPMNIYQDDKYPWLKTEKRYIKSVMDNGKKVIGLCLGAQLIADVLGGKVTQNPEREIGWLGVSLTEQALNMPFFSNFPKDFIVFQWHGDTFSILPQNAVLIAGSDACRHQAFSYDNRVFGFQFHLENTDAVISSLIQNCADEMTDGKYVQNADYIISNNKYISSCNILMKKFLNNLMNN